MFTTACGYAAGFTPNPTYEEVCSGQTGHTEAVQVVYDPSKLAVRRVCYSPWLPNLFHRNSLQNTQQFSDILRWFWESHDPSQGMRQGNDRGTQYRSGLYWFDEEQKALILASKAVYEKVLGWVELLA